METAVLTAVYEADTRNFERGSDRVERALKDQERAAERATREITQTYARAGSAIQNLAGRLPGGGRLSAISSLKSDIDDLSAASKAAGGGLAGLGAGLSAVGGPAVLATAGIAGLTAAVTAVGVAVFGAAKGFSDAGSQIYDLSRNVGISAETLSGFKVAADESGSSLEAIGAGLNRFNILIREAAGGSKEATETLKRFGIEPQEALRNSEAALQQVLSRIKEMPEELQPMAVSMAFGSRSGAALTATLQSMGFSLEEAREKARDLGQMFDTEGARRADEFGDTLTDLQKTATGLANAFGREVAPALTDAMRDITAELNDNRSAAAGWGEAFADIVRGVRVAAQSDLLAIADTVTGVTHALSALVQFGGAVSGLGGIVGGLRAAGAANRGAFSDGAGTDETTGRRGLGGGGFFGGRGGGGRGGGRGGGGRSRARGEGDLGGAFGDIAAEFAQADKLAQELQRRIDTLGDSTHRTAIETRFLAGEFSHLSKEQKDALLELAETQDAQEWFSKVEDAAHGFIDELRGGVTPLEEFDRTLGQQLETLERYTYALTEAQRMMILAGRSAAAHLTLDGLRSEGKFSLMPGAGLADDPGVRGTPSLAGLEVDKWREFKAEFKAGLKEMRREMDYQLRDGLVQILTGDWRGGLQSMVFAFRDSLAVMAADLLASQFRSLLKNLLGSVLGSLAGGFSFGGGGGGFGGGGAGGSFADGGHYNAFAPRLTGERGPELDFPGHSGAIVSNEQIRRALGAGGPQTQDNRTINFYLPPERPGNHVQRQSRRQQAETIVSFLSR